MRILFCTDTFPPQLNGVSVVTAAMVTGLRSRGWECGVMAPAYGPAYSPAARSVRPEPTMIPHFPVRAWSWPPYPEVRLAWPSRQRVGALMDTFRPDVVHCATELLVGRAGLLEATARGIPVCTTYHTDFSRYCDAYGVPFLRPLVRRWIARFHRRATRTLVPSPTAQRDLSTLRVTGTHVWGGGIDAEQFHPRHYSLLTRHRYAIGSAFTFLFVGRLAPEKNVELLLDAFARLQMARPTHPVRLLIAGTGPSEAALRARAGAGVTFLGAVDRATDLPALYASTDAFVFASATETLGLVLLEAMASGLPVIACQAGGVADYLEDERNGLAFAPGHVDGCVRAMTRVMEDESLRERVRSGARTTADAMSCTRELDRLDAMLRDLVTSPVSDPTRRDRWRLLPAT
jgi:glycosyltransferase involved in cell wall biosynthesis